MEPALALAIDSCVNESSAIISSVIRKINEVRVFKRKCEKLRGDAETLTKLLERRKSAVDSLQTLQNLENCLQGVKNFVESCTSLNVVNVGFEVFVRRKYPALRKELHELREIFVFESVTEILAREGTAVKNQDCLLQGQVSQNQVLENIQKAIEEQERHRLQPFSPSSWPQIITNFELNNDLQIEFDSQDPPIGRGLLENAGAVICYPVLQSSTAKENLDVYRNIQEGAFVQRFYGTLKASDKFYAVMEDLSDEPTLNRYCQNRWASTTLFERAKLASDLAKTMAWYHKAQLLLKSVSDLNVVLKKLPSAVMHPILTKLENVRNIYQKTTNFEYDIRYEAPEYDSVRERSSATDVWSLGIVLWQCLTGQFPYGVAEEVLKDTEECRIIRESLSHEELPGTIDDYEEAPGLADIIRQCWTRDPMLRPTASAVALRLIDVTAHLAVAESNLVSADMQSSAAARNTLDVLENRQIATIQKRTLDIIRDARHVNKNSTDLVQSTARIDLNDFNMLLEDGTDPLTSFLLGAAFWWNVNPVSLDDPGTGFIPVLTLSNNGKRAVRALPYLEDAVRHGYQPAYFEMYKAHALLAREYKSHAPPTV